MKPKTIQLGYVAMYRYTPTEVLSPDHDEEKVEPDEIVLEKNEYTLIIDYPLDVEFKKVFKVDAKGMTRRELVNVIVESYKNVYANSEEYGVWGHYFGDLMLSDAEVIAENTIRLGVDS